MVVVKFGPIVSDARGSLGGTVFTRSRAGAVIRSKIKPVDPISNLRTTWQSAMSQAFYRWRNVLTVTHRQSWIDLANATDFTNALGQTYHPAPWNLYLRTTSFQIKFNMSFTDTAPASAVATYHPVVYSQTGIPPAIIATADAAWNDATNIFFWSTLPVPVTQNFNKGPYPSLVSGLAAFWKLGEAPQLPSQRAAGDRIFFRSRAIQTDGALSATVRTTFDVV